MEQYLIYFYLMSAIVPLISFVYGRIALRGQKALYPRMIVDGVGCMSLGQLFICLYYQTTGSYPHGFHIGLLSGLGTFAFFLTANYGQIDSLVDDGGKKEKKYRVIAGIAPILVIVEYILTYLKVQLIGMKVSLAVISICIAFADYYHLKHIIIPDVRFGICRCLRGFNLMALIYSVLYLARFYLGANGRPMSFYIVFALSIVVSGLLVPFMQRGMKRWRI